MLGSIDGAQVLLTEQPAAENSIQIDVAPWTGEGWARNCGIYVSYVPTLVAEDSFCKLKACGAALEAVRRVARQAAPLQGEAPSAAGEADPELKHLRALAGNTVGFPTVPGSPGYDFLPRNPSFLVSIQRQPMLAVVGPWQSGPAVDSLMIGSLVVIWQPKGDTLSAVAGFRLRTAMQVVRAATVTR